MYKFHSVSPYYTTVDQANKKIFVVNIRNSENWLFDDVSEIESKEFYKNVLKQDLFSIFLGNLA